MHIQYTIFKQGIIMKKNMGVLSTLLYIYNVISYMIFLMIYLKKGVLTVGICNKSYSTYSHSFTFFY